MRTTFPRSSSHPVRALPPHCAWLAGVLVALALSACGGGNGSSNVSGSGDSGPIVTPPVSSPLSEPAVAPIEGGKGAKALVIQIDGLTHAALRESIAAGRAPGLAALTLAPAWTGGSNGTLSAQRTTAGPGWASLLTGTWAHRHGVRWDTADQRIADAAPTFFASVHASQPAARASAVTSTSLYAALLAADVRSGALANAVDCAGDDNCVTQRASRAMLAGDVLVLAQYGAPAIAARREGLHGKAYGDAVTATAAAVDALLATVARRRANDPGDDWLVLVTTGYGLDEFGSASGLQLAANKTVFIASNKPLPALTDVGAAAPSDERLTSLAATTDIAPTVLRQLGVAGGQDFDGGALQARTALRQLSAVTGADKASIALSWTLVGDPSSPVQVLRDGVLIATLPAGTTGYTDAIEAASDGVYSHRYTLVAGEARAALSAQIAYVKPTALAPTLLDGLANYYALDALPAVDARAASTLAPRAADADGGTLVTDEGFKPPFAAKALRVDSRIKNGSGTAGYRLQQTHDLAADPAVAAFTIGFWVRTDASCSQGVSNGATVLGNKNYDSGNNAGIVVSLWSGCEIRFNAGSGSARADSNGYNLSAGQWAYVAVVIDKAALKMTGYVFDPAKGTQTGSAALTTAINAKLGGLGNGLSLNEDGTGLYYQRWSASPRGAMDFNDLAIWGRALSADELASIFKSGKPLSSLRP